MGEKELIVAFHVKDEEELEQIFASLDLAEYRIVKEPTFLENAKK